MSRTPLRSSTLAVVAVAAIMAAGCRNYGPDTVPTQGQRMTTTQLNDLFERAERDKQVFVDSSQAERRYGFRSGGRMTSTTRSGAGTLSGQWWVDNHDRLCIRLETQQESCRAVYSLPGDSFYIHVPGASQPDNTMVMRPAE